MANQQDYPASNLTWQIPNHAEEHNYASGAYNCYNTAGVMAVIRAAERKNSAAIIQLFPWTMHFQGREFIKYVVQEAHASSVPVAVHLDHCIGPEDVEQALTLPFDSIMVDASTEDEAQNIRWMTSVVGRARSLNITIEAEMGRIEDGEDGPPTVDLESVVTRPEEAEPFVRETGVHFLAPSFGNIHGGYPSSAQESWDLPRPLTLRDEAIDVEFPGVNKGNEVDLGALEWNHDGVNATFSCSQALVPCIYALRFDRIVAEIKLMIYRVSRVPHRVPWPSDLASWQQDVESSCRALIQEVESRQRGRRSKSSPPLSLMVVQKLQVKYHSCIMLLYRPSPQIPRPTQDAARTCFDSAMEIIRVSANLHRFTSMDYTWLSAHSIFVAAITILYSLWTNPAVTVASHTGLCFERVHTAEQLLEYLGKTWSVAHSAREKLSYLIHVAMEGYDTLHGTAEIRNSPQQPPDIVDRGGECYDSNAVNDWSQQGVNVLVDELGMMREFFDLDWLDNVAVSQWN